MIKDISKYKFYGRSQLVQLRSKYTAQKEHIVHCSALEELLQQSKQETDKPGLGKLCWCFYEYFS